jgi:hypothetical protein
MKIKESSDTMPFRNLPHGKFFVNENSGEYYQKSFSGFIAKIPESVDDNELKGYNCYHLKTGAICECEPSTPVRIIRKLEIIDED